MSATCFAEEPSFEVISERDEIFIRAGTDAGLTVGATLRIVGDQIGNTAERRRIGTATVVAVAAGRSQVRLDEAARTDPSAHKFVTLEKKTVVPPLETLTPPPPPPSVTMIRAAPAGGLLGHATFRGLSRWKVLVLTNDEARNWTHCTLKLPGNLAYVMEKLAAGDHEA